jgi:hypothetical protein
MLLVAVSIRGEPLSYSGLLDFSKDDFFSHKTTPIEDLLLTRSLPSVFLRILSCIHLSLA